MKRFLRWMTVRRLAIGLLLAGNAFISLVGSTFGDGVLTYGLLLSQPVALGLWAVLGPRPFPWQTIQALCLGWITFSQSMFGVLIEDWRRNAARVAAARPGAPVVMESSFHAESFVALAAMYSILFVIIWIAAAACRLALGWRLALEPGRDLPARVTAGQHVSLRAIFTDVTLAAIALALVVRLPIDWDVDLTPLLHAFEPMLIITGLALAIGPTACGLLFLILGSTTRSWPNKIMTAIFGGIGSAAMAWILTAYVIDMELTHLLKILLVQSLTLAGNMLLGRAAGYRLLDRGAVRQQAAAIASSADLSDSVPIAA